MIPSGEQHRATHTQRPNLFPVTALLVSCPAIDSPGTDPTRV
ncbi:hypothetical protein Rhow_006748 [Rhodococcus wratislaviensis]|uniref:Uncharacterized protein n=1 Tax=Rhodococcus wratislaviensis TaxID=44752 RepID=A0A402CGD9_RHOWR|nr:hypothetical protein Rhow_006748 [Rhodococcus wratislaviensis]